jgi:DNA segregation ATPase FtsK/SpoIIIE, S-DNA-T family
MKKNTEGQKKKDKTGTGNKKSFLSDERLRFIVGILLTGFAVYLLVAFIAYLIWWKTDQSLDPSLVISGSDVEVKNWSGRSGAWFAYIIINKGFGLGAFFIPLIIGSVGLHLLNFPKIKVWKMIFRFTFATIILSLCLGFIFGESEGYLGSGPGGAHGYLITNWMNGFMGKIGTGVVLVFVTITYLIFSLRIPTSDTMVSQE